MSESRYEAVGFIGLGAMGRPMAASLINKLPPSTKLNVFDVVPSVVEQFTSEYPDRAISRQNAKDVAANSEVVLTMVPEGSHVRSVYLDEGTGICCSDVSGKLLIDCSTIDTATSLAVKDHIAARYPTAAFYDAPVSGGVVGATRGTIAIFLGCAETDSNLKRLTDLLGMMGKDVIPCGGPSLGLAAKLSNNYLSGIIAIACSEAMDMGMRSGLDPRTLTKVYAAGTAQNAICDRFNPCPGVNAEAPSSNGYRGGFKVQLMRKDFSLAVEMASRTGSKNVLGKVGLETYEAASEDPSCRDLDSRVVFRFLGGNEKWRQEADEH